MALITLKHERLGSRTIQREGCVVTISSGDSVDNEEMFNSELTAKAYEHFLLLHHNDMGFKRVD